MRVCGPARVSLSSRRPQARGRAGRGSEAWSPQYAPAIFRAVQSRLGIRGQSPRSVCGYVAGDGRRVWIQELGVAPEEFYLAFGPLDPSGGYLTTRLPARRATVQQREPEPHPGSLTPTIFIGIEITADESGHFDRH